VAAQKDTMGLPESNRDADGQTADASLRAPRHPWLPEAAFLTILAVIVTLVFAFSPLDIEAARQFYRPETLDHWKLAKDLPWSVLYRAAPGITASLVVTGLIALAAGVVRNRNFLRRQAVFLLLSVVIGPGLFINFVFKDHWDRPRPREIVEFGGPLQYVPAPLPGHESGASFPCGHCSVGFLYGAGWWIWRRRPAWARLSMAVGLVTGVALGLGRMAAGGHFLSDVIWSAILAFGVCHIIYYYVLHLHRDEFAGFPASHPRRAHPRWHQMTAIAAALGGVGVLIALFVTPHGTLFKETVPLSSLPGAPQVMVFEAKAADVEIVLLDPTAAQISIEGELHGFGLPMSKLQGSLAFELEPQPTLRYRIEQTGWFTDLDGSAIVLLPAVALQRIVVRLGHGDIRVRDETGMGVVRRRIVQLDLMTADGHVQTPMSEPPP
jgi:membrane-associated PAP2 superfamily phosphatase